ncbi:MAG: peptidase M14, partial [Tistrella sp.]|nr:peptidase M14 [Tistrella sp.]
GRPVLARHRQGSDHPVMISGGQHANEVSGVAGAIRAAALLAARPTAHFTIAPVENPDGYAMHRRLTRSQPDHMHHAARYTALGDDLEYRRQTGRGQIGPLYEAAIRVEARARTGADLHLNLHGYPSHEWTRPLTGYVPRGFEMWTVPKGFFLILRHHPGWEDRARRLLTRVTAELAHLPELAALNARQIALYEIHAGRLGFEMIDGFPCMVSEQPAQVPVVTLITEYPDETVYGAAFRLAHEAQSRAVLAAYDAWQAIMTGTD